ncbi:hypothetical protein [Coralloluteibacterium stylophorae]|uniref:Uncharacterized protein n=1 Tax=Coralloluteibacterium stylophorae TaxID=1776034 RepID=A0A8J7VSY2_9GAMM|nr:hypothetical protein [Coralloluteibacterium stylophorae]MBS7457717.1 hypothetical protein [Coralloluteibacterium stylophorae]
MEDSIIAAAAALAGAALGGLFGLLSAKVSAKNSEVLQNRALLHQELLSLRDIQRARLEELLTQITHPYVRARKLHMLCNKHSGEMTDDSRQALLSEIWAAAQEWDDFEPRGSVLVLGYGQSIHDRWVEVIDKIGVFATQVWETSRATDSAGCPSVDKSFSDVKDAVGAVQSAVSTELRKLNEIRDADRPAETPKPSQTAAG